MQVNTRTKSQKQNYGNLYVVTRSWTEVQEVLLNDGERTVTVRVTATAIDRHSINTDSTQHSHWTATTNWQCCTRDSASTDNAWNHQLCRNIQRQADSCLYQPQLTYQLTTSFTDRLTSDSQLFNWQLAT